MSRLGWGVQVLAVLAVIGMLVGAGLAPQPPPSDAGVGSVERR